MSNPMRKISLPSVSAGTITNTVEAVRFLDGVKQNLDIICGRTQNQHELQALPTNASLADVIAIINRISARLNASGESTVAS